MSDEQITILGWAYTKGLDHGFEETMRAMAWQESSCGVKLRNPGDKGGGSWGIFGASAHSAFHRLYGWDRCATPKELRDVAEMLVKYPEKAAAICIKELNAWSDKCGRNQWSLIWASYNAGNEFENGEDYAKDIKAKIMFLRRVI